jgi:DnaJ-class molecular chaperone
MASARELRQGTTPQGVHWRECPVCQGDGIRQEAVSGYGPGASIEVPCEACEGEGVLVDLQPGDAGQ